PASPPRMLVRSIPKLLKKFYSEIVSTRKITSPKKILSLVCALLIAFLFLSAVSIFLADYKGVAVYRFIKLLEFVFVFFYTVDVLKKISFSKVALVFSVSGILQGIIAVAQFAFQRSLGLGILGEPHLVAGRQEVAEFVAFGARFMRAYGTFSSPNVLAAFLGFAFLFLLAWFLLQDKPERKHFLFVWAGTVIIGIGLILTFSRAVIFAFSLTLIFYICFILFSKSLKHFKRNLFFALVPIFSSVILFVLIFWPEVYSRALTAFARGDFAIKERVFFNKISLQVIQENIFGVGFGNYTLFLRDVFGGLRDQLYQPVHNIFLLLASEAGIIASVIFLLFIAGIFWGVLQKYLKLKDATGVFLLSAILFIVIGGLFDHFYITIQQGGLMFWVLLGASYSYIRNKG
ncbi:MAG: O-antigen ligase family protein, partial [Candidatus Spechtbacteria bacterium]|nr:O-antigen ligase family protein [Candidatus Spechtbacteria bacterium]